MSKTYEFKITCDIPIKVRVDRTVTITAKSEQDLRKKLEFLVGQEDPITSGIVMNENYTIIDDSIDIGDMVEHNLNDFKGVRLEDSIESIMNDPSEFLKE